MFDKNTLFFLVFADESAKDFVGQIRFKRESESSIECVISLSITEEFRGKHIAGEFIELGIEELKKNWHNIETVVAEVKDENAASNGLFLKEGFELFSKDNMYRFSFSENVYVEVTLYNIKSYSCNFCKYSHVTSFKEVA